MAVAVWARNAQQGREFLSFLTNWLLVAARWRFGSKADKGQRDLTRRDPRRKRRRAAGFIYSPILIDEAGYERQKSCPMESITHGKVHDTRRI